MVRRGIFRAAHAHDVALGKHAQVWGASRETAEKQHSELTARAHLSLPRSIRRQDGAILRPRAESSSTKAKYSLSPEARVRDDSPEIIAEFYDRRYKHEILENLMLAMDTGSRISISAASEGHL